MLIQHSTGALRIVRKPGRNRSHRGRRFTGLAVQQRHYAIACNGEYRGIGEIFWGTGIAQLFNAPGLPPCDDPRTPKAVGSLRTAWNR